MFGIGVRREFGIWGSEGVGEEWRSGGEIGLGGVWWS